MRSALRVLPTAFVVALSAVVLYAGPDVTAQNPPPPVCEVVCGSTASGTVPLSLPPELRIRQLYVDECTPDLVFVDMPPANQSQFVRLVMYSGTVTSTADPLVSVPLLALAIPRPAGESGWMTVHTGRPLVADFDFYDNTVTTTPAPMHSVLELSSLGDQVPLTVSASEIEFENPFSAVDADTGDPLGFRVDAERCVSGDLIVDVPWTSLDQQPATTQWISYATTTLGLILEFNLQATSTVGWAEMPLAGPPPLDAPPLVLFDPGDLLEPVPGLGVPTSSMELKPSPHPRSLYPSWVPFGNISGLLASGTIRDDYIAPKGRHWLRIPNYEGLELAVDDREGGSGHPSRLWRMGVSGQVEELEVDLAFRMIGVATTTGPIVSAPPPVSSQMSVRAHPSPFRETTRIGWRAPRKGELQLEVFDLRGRRVRVLSVGAADPEGWTSWDGKNDRGQRLPAGTYLVQARIEGVGVASEKVILLH